MEKTHCHNCNKVVEKPLRCGKCKEVSYCSTPCQKDDWQFHKRNCKKAEVVNVPTNVPVYIRSHRNEDLQDADGKLKFSTNRSSSEQWVFTKTASGRFIINSHRKQNLQDNTVFVSLSDNELEFEQWSIKNVPGNDGKFIIKSHRSQNLQDCEGHAGLSQNELRWEWWSIIEASKDTSGHIVKTPERQERKSQEHETVVDNENDIGTWYRHREWNPTEEPKKEFRPVQIDSPEKTPSPGVESKPAAGYGSAWNAAGTWEDKDATAMARTMLRECFEGMQNVEGVGGILSAAGIEYLEGEASKPVVRGKLRHMFDFSFKIILCCKWSDSEGHQNVECTLAVSDFTNDTFSEGVLSAPVVELSFKDAQKLDRSRRWSIEALVGSASWPPPAGSFMELAATRMKEFSKEYDNAT